VRKIVELRVLDGYRVWLRFDDGVTGEVDFSGKAHTGVFSRWKDYENFRGARIDADGQLAWDDQLDFSADSLWMKVTGRWPNMDAEPEGTTAHA
jgi:hypothetical protein